MAGSMSQADTLLRLLNEGVLPTAEEIEPASSTDVASHATAGPSLSFMLQSAVLGRNRTLSSSFSGSNENTEQEQTSSSPTLLPRKADPESASAMSSDPLDISTANEDQDDLDAVNSPPVPAFSYLNPFDMLSLMKDKDGNKDSSRHESNSQDVQAFSAQQDFNPQVSPQIDNVSLISSLPISPSLSHMVESALVPVMSSESSRTDIPSNSEGSLLDTLMKDSSPLLNMRPLSPDHVGSRRGSFTSITSTDNLIQLPVTIVNKDVSPTEEETSMIENEGTNTADEILKYPFFLPHEINNAVQSWADLSAKFHRNNTKETGYVFLNDVNPVPPNKKSTLTMSLDDRNSLILETEPIIAHPISIINSDVSFLDDDNIPKWDTHLVRVSDDFYAYASKGGKIRVIHQLKGANTLIKLHPHDKTSFPTDIAFSRPGSSEPDTRYLGATSDSTIFVYYIGIHDDKFSVDLIWQFKFTEKESNTPISLHNIMWTSQHLIVILRNQNTGWIALANIQNIDPQVKTGFALVNSCDITEPTKHWTVVQAHNNIITAMGQSNITGYYFTGSSVGEVKLWNGSSPSRKFKIGNGNITHISTLFATIQEVFLYIATEGNTQLHIVSISRQDNVAQILSTVNLSSSSSPPDISITGVAYHRHTGILLLACYQRMSLICIRHTYDHPPIFSHFVEYALPEPILSMDIRQTHKSSDGGAVTMYVCVVYPRNIQELELHVKAVPLGSMDAIATIPSSIEDSPPIMVTQFSYIKKKKDKGSPVQTDSIAVGNVSIPSIADNSLTNGTISSTSVKKKKGKGSPDVNATDKPPTTIVSVAANLPDKRQQPLQQSLQPTTTIQSKPVVGIELNSTNVKIKSKKAQQGISSVITASVPSTFSATSPSTHHVPSTMLNVSAAIMPSTSMTSTQYSNLLTNLTKHIDRQLDTLHARLEKERLERQAMEAVRQETLLKVVSQTLTNNVSGVLREVVQNEVNHTILPTITSLVERQVSNVLGTSINNLLIQKLPTMLEQHLTNCLHRLMQRPPVVEMVGKVMAANISPILETVVKDSFRDTLIPAYQNATSVMFQQIANAFEQGLGQVFEQQVQQLRTATFDFQHAARTLDQNTTNSNSTGYQNAASILSPTDVRSPLQSASTVDRHQTLGIPTFPQTGYGIRLEIDAMLKSKQYETAFTKVLAMSDLTLVHYLIKTLSLSQIFPPNQTPLISQPVILSFLHQLSIDLLHNMDRNIAWMQETVMALDAKDPTIHIHCIKFLPIISQRIEALYRKCANEQPPNAHARALKLLMHVVHSVLM